MALDPAPLAEHAAEVIDEILEEYGAEVELLDAVVVVELSEGSGDNVRSTVGVYPMGERNVVAVGLLVRGLVAAVNPDE